MTSFQIPEPSPFLETGFYVFAGVVALSLPLACWRATGDSRYTRWMAALSLGWMSLTGFLTTRSEFHSFELPPPLFLTLVVGLLLVSTLVNSPLGTRMVSSLSLAGLVLFQAFRLPLELLMHRAYSEGLMPVQMSFEGRNLDIVTGVTALVLGLALLKFDVPRLWVWLWNLMGLGLLVNVVTVAILSTPVPFRHFMNDPPNVWILRMPFIWLPMIMVMAAWFGHLAIYRKLKEAADRPQEP